MAGVLHLLTGATASGKEAVALHLATRAHGEIVSVDSMKIYRGMNIGTAKPSIEDRRRVRHHMIDVVEPSESYSLAHYLENALEAKDAVEARGRLPVFSGGTPLYIRSLAYGVFSGPSANWTLRRELMDKAKREGTHALHAELQARDPVAADRIHPNDAKRIIRALEVFSLTGRRISDLHRQGPQAGPVRPVRIVALRRQAEDLRQRMEARIERMFSAGLVEEVRALMPHLGRTARNGVGYREVVQYLRGAQSLDETRQCIARRTWRMSRKQMTWFRGLPDVVWVDVSPGEAAESVADRVLRLWDPTHN
jgi:tRNA dimethylallyltransferase